MTTELFDVVENAVRELVPPGCGDDPEFVETGKGQLIMAVIVALTKLKTGWIALSAERDAAFLKVRKSEKSQLHRLSEAETALGEIYQLAAQADTELSYAVFEIARAALATDAPAPELAEGPKR